jgi:hypothetical protein
MILSQADHKANWTGRLLLAVIACLIVSSCQYTKLTSYWSDLDAPERYYNKIGVVAIAQDKGNRARMEGSLVGEMNEAGLNAVNTLGVFPNAGKFTDLDADGGANRRAIEDALRTRRIGALLIVSVLDIREKEYYVEGTEKTYTSKTRGTVVRPVVYSVFDYPSYGYGLYDFYSTHTSTIKEPGYYNNSVSYFLEFSLFDVATEKMIWAAQTETTDPTSVEKEIRKIAGIVTERLVSDKVLKAK